MDFIKRMEIVFPVNFLALIVKELISVFLASKDIFLTFKLSPALAAAQIINIIVMELVYHVILSVIFVKILLLIVCNVQVVIFKVQSLDNVYHLVKMVITSINLKNYVKNVLVNV